MKIAFLDTVHSVLEEGLTASGHECHDLTKSNKAEVLSQIGFYDGIVIRSRFPLTNEFLKECKSLKFIARSGAGLENIDLAYCEKASIELFAAPEGNRNAVAEHALGMLLSLFNNICAANFEVKNGIWDREGNRGVELNGKTVGVIGYGNNGCAFVQKLFGFDVNILVYDKYKAGFGTDQIHEVELGKLLAESDIISLHIPQNEETMGLIDADFINRMRKPFYLVNLSRGKIVKTDALIEGLKKGKILGACLDVLEFEKSSFENMFDHDQMPESFKELIDQKNVLLTPHVGGWTHESYKMLSEVLLNKILAHFQG